MKKRVFVVLFGLLAFGLFASNLLLIETESPTETKNYFNLETLRVNYFCDDFVIATSDDIPAFTHTVIEANAWAKGESYFLLWLKEGDNTEYIKAISGFATVLVQKEKFLVVKLADENARQIFPIVHGGVVRINNIEAKLPKPLFNYRNIRFEEDPFVTELLGYVDEVELETTVQHLQDYGTRNWYTTQSTEAQDWIFDKFESYGLSTELMYIPYGGTNASQNVIAILPGILYPEEYVVLGAHYDSYAYGGDAPGADDNATGSAGILEIARILSQYEFNRTIIFCTFSGEEYGLHGSEEYATIAENTNMDILGYFNIDMSGYLHPGDYIHTDMIAPSSAQELVDFYTDVVGIYLPDFPVEPGMLTGGDSDHTSFNNHGYLGIFPFEDSQNHSPHIHTSDDIIGPSVNDFEMVSTFTQATMASVVTMANMLLPPSNLTAIPGDEMVTLLWDGMEDVDSFNIYRNGEPEPYASTIDTVFVDTDVINGEVYTYYVTAIYSGSGDESIPSNTVTTIPMPPITLPFADDFETGAPYWSFTDSWGLTESQSFSATHSITESPDGEYGNNLNITAGLTTVNLTGFIDADLKFWTKYVIELNYDYMYLEISYDGVIWTELDSFTGTQYNWEQKTYSLSDYLDEENVQIRFRMYSDTYVEEDGMYIDDFEIEVETGVGTGSDLIVKNYSISNYPNPFNPATTINFNLKAESHVELNIFDIKGHKIRTLVSEQVPAGAHSTVWNGKDDRGNIVSSGLYFYKIEAGSYTETKKMILVK